MGLLCDTQIIARCLDAAGNKLERPMIWPFAPVNIRERELHPGLLMHAGRKPMRKIIPFGTSSYGYDATLTEDFKIFNNLNATIIDPKRFDAGCYTEGKVLTDTDGARYVILPPNSFLLGLTAEYFIIPRDIMVECLGKSTWARCGAVVNPTPLEPEWEGHVVIEVSNTTTLPMKVYAHEGICQLLFHEASEVCKTSYADKNGKYNKQMSIEIKV